MKKAFFYILMILLGITQLSCRENKEDSKKMVYKVKRADLPVAIDGQWDSGQWSGADIIELKNYMGDKPKHFPNVQARVLYDDSNIYVFFRVEDNYVRCVADETHGKVWQDSCVEFFFTPSSDESDIRYFNLEANCGGTILFHYGDKQTRQPIDVSDCQRIEIFHSLPRIVAEEITEPTLWFLQYKIPMDIIRKYSQIVDEPGSGTIWRANFYKCADKTSHPHWLTWNYVDNPRPAFHLPEYFGTIEFE